MKLFKRLLLIVLLGVTLVGCEEYSDDYVHITGLDYKAVVVDEENSDGKVVITETLTFDAYASSEDNLFWELWRDLPESYTDGVKVEYNVLSVKQILDDGTEVVYEESPKLYWWDEDYVGYDGQYGPGKWYHSKGPYDGEYNFECLLFYVDGLYRETVTFEIEYEMINASLRYNDASELYLSLFYGDDIKYLESVKGQILFPEDKMPQAGNYDAFTYGTNAHEFPFEESDTLNPGYHTFSFELTGSDLAFKPFNQYIEFALIAHGEDKHSFTQYASENYYYNTDMLAKIQEAQAEYEQLPIVAQQNKQIIFIASVIGAVGICAITWLIVLGSKRKYKQYKPTTKIDFFRDIPSDLDANFARRLVFSKKQNTDDFGDGYSAALLSLVYKGYVDIEQIDPAKDWKAKNVKITIREDNPAQPRKQLTIVEERYFNLLNKHAGGKEITHNQFQQRIEQDYQHTDAFVKGVKSAVDKIGTSEGYFQTNKFKKVMHTMVGWAIAFIVIGLLIIIGCNIGFSFTRIELANGAFFILGGGFILSAIYLLKASKGYILYTQFGVDEYEKWYGLYKFLNSETLMKERTVLELALWEKYLIYATAFGISEKVIKALKIRCPETMMNNSTILRTPYFRSSYFYHSTSNAFRTATHGASFTARTGGHGGFGGGGRGGGGGGGGH